MMVIEINVKIVAIIIRKNIVKNNKQKINNRQKQYYEQNIDKITEHHKEYYKLNEDKFVEYNKEYYEQNKDEILVYRKEYRDLNKDKIIEYQKEYRELNKDKLLEYYELNKDKISEYHKEYYEKNKIKLNEATKQYYKDNKDKILQYNLKYVKNRRNTDPIFRLIVNNRSRIFKTLKSNSKANNTIELLQCNRLFFYNWIQFQLPYEMSDDEFKKLYDIDHVKPIASFDLSIKENQFEAFFWSNCCPLLKHKNRSKGAKRNLWLEVLQELKAIVFLKLYYPEFCSSNVEEACSFNF